MRALYQSRPAAPGEPARALARAGTQRHGRSALPRGADRRRRRRRTRTGPCAGPLPRRRRRRWARSACTAHPRRLHKACRRCGVCSAVRGRVVDARGAVVGPDRQVVAALRPRHRAHRASFCAVSDPTCAPGHGYRARWQGASHAASLLAPLAAAHPTRRTRAGAATPTRPLPQQCTRWAHEHSLTTSADAGPRGAHGLERRLHSTQRLCCQRLCSSGSRARGVHSAQHDR